MSDPRFRDPRVDPPPIQEDEIRRGRRLNELDSSNAMWGWVAGAVVLALVLIFVFTRGQVSDNATHTASNPPAATTTGSAPVNSPPPAAHAPKTTPAPSPNK